MKQNILTFNQREDVDQKWMIREYFCVHLDVSMACYLVKPPTHCYHQYISVQSAKTYNYLHPSEEEERKKREKKNRLHENLPRVLKKPITGNSRPILVAIYIPLANAVWIKQNVRGSTLNYLTTHRLLSVLKLLFRSDRLDSQSLWIFYMN